MSQSCRGHSLFGTFRTSWQSKSQKSGEQVFSRLLDKHALAVNCITLIIFKSSFWSHVLGECTFVFFQKLSLIVVGSCLNFSSPPSNPPPPPPLREHEDALIPVARPTPKGPSSSVLGSFHRGNACSLLRMAETVNSLGKCVEPTKTGTLIFGRLNHHLWFS